MPYETFLDTRLFGPLGMKDTTFWPNPEQIARLAKSYKPNADKNGPGRDDHRISSNIRSTTSQRQPMPAGGLFSTASDLARFCQMVLNGGEFQGKRYLSEAAVKQMTSKQTGDLPNGYGFGWSTGGDVFRPRRRLCHRHVDRLETWADHDLARPARRLSRQRQPGPRHLQACGRRAARRVEKVTVRLRRDRLIALNRRAPARQL